MLLPSIELLTSKRADTQHMTSTHAHALPVVSGKFPEWLALILPATLTSPIDFKAAIRSGQDALGELFSHKSNILDFILSTINLHDR